MNKSVYQGQRFYDHFAQRTPVWWKGEKVRKRYHLASLFDEIPYIIIIYIGECN